ncbi:hypothetical protein NDU88_008625 [Pleurodeles waltl]|uniref:Uncharacterized protein n=1 Tax=Pleurodeles waltl TaxID=8319 RepID=A0AAV7PS56_PLEWA|nr:hypothetical protein NDU88_008625 [Pleurodeles waltl]
MRQCADAIEGSAGKPGRRAAEGLLEEKEQEEKDSRVRWSGALTRGEESQEPWGEDGRGPKKPSSVTERRESEETSHSPGGMWLLQVRDRVCGLLTEYIGKGGRDQAGGTGTREHCT